MKITITPTQAAAIRDGIDSGSEALADLSLAIGRATIEGEIFDLQAVAWWAGYKHEIATDNGTHPERRMYANLLTRLSKAGIEDSQRDSLYRA